MGCFFSFFSKCLTFLYFVRYESLFASRMDPTQKIPRTTGYCLVARHFTVRHGVWWHPLRARRSNCSRDRQLRHENSGTSSSLSAMRRPHPSLPGIPAVGPTDFGADFVASVVEFRDDDAAAVLVRTARRFLEFSCHHDSRPVHVSSSRSGIDALQSGHVTDRSFAQYDDSRYDDDDDDGHSGASAESTQHHHQQRSAESVRRIATFILQLIVIRFFLFRFGFFIQFVISVVSVLSPPPSPPPPPPPLPAASTARNPCRGSRCSCGR